MRSGVISKYILVGLVVVPCARLSAAPIEVTFTGVAQSCTIGQYSLGQTQYKIDGLGDTSQRTPVSGGYNLPLSSLTVDLLPGNITPYSPHMFATLTIPTRLGVNSVGIYSGVYIGRTPPAYDIFDFAGSMRDWDLLTSIGPIKNVDNVSFTGTGGAKNIPTDQGNMSFTFSSGATATFQGIVTPEPAAAITPAIAALIFSRTRRTRHAAAIR